MTTVRPGRPAAPIRIVGTPGARLVGTKGLRLLSEPRRFVGLEARDGSVMNVRNARMELLGYDRAERYGVSWRTGATSGVVHRSLFRGSFYGVYTHGIAALRVTESVVEESHRYGLDPHSGSRNLVIESNIFRRNGKHGTILAVGCWNATVRNNQSYQGVAGPFLARNQVRGNPARERVRVGG